MPQSHHLDQLNPEQCAAVNHAVAGHGSNIGGPLLVLAGAGTGKTKTLAHRFAHLVKHGADPTRILLLTFTRQAAQEMTSRVKHIVGQNSAAKKETAAVNVSWSSTFHAIGLRLLRIYAKRVSLNPMFTVHDRDDSADLMEMVRHDLGFTDKHKPFPKKDTCLAIYSRGVNAQQSLGVVIAKHFPAWVKCERKLRKLFQGYVAAKQAQQVLDFDDLLLYWDELLKNEAMARLIGDRFDHILVDEFQDTNALQGSILRRMKPDGRGLMVVGDDAQSIYGFRAAEVRNILDFPKQFDPPATVIKLERNYRSTAPILSASNAVINLATEGFGKRLTTTRKGGEKPRLVTTGDEMSQANFVADEIQLGIEQGRSLKDHAVLFRASHHSAMLEFELARRGIPFKKFGGKMFSEAAHVKDMLSVLRWAENPADRVTGLRVLKLLPGIGHASASKLLDGMGQSGSWTEMSAAPSPKRSAMACKKLFKLLNRLHTSKINWPEQVDAVRLWYQPYLEAAHDDAAERALDLDQLQTIACTFKSRQKFLTDMTLDPPTKREKKGAAPKGEDDDYVTLSTIHSCKGREWHTVFVLSVIEGCIPSSRAESASEIEEERRLLYVAMTRAKRELSLIMPWRTNTNGRSWSGNGDVTTQRSPFIPDSILPRFAESTWRADDEPDDTSVWDEASFDLPGRIKESWQLLE